MKAYSFRKEVVAKAESSRGKEEHRSMWKRVWRLPIKPKLKHFLWRCIPNWLSTCSVVKGNGMVVDDICRRCGAEQETREHLYFQCMESSVIWKLAPINWEGIHCLTCSFEEWSRTICFANKDPKY